MQDLRTDSMLMEILQERKTITGFLDSIFGFLCRNTDFYHIKMKECEKVGFQKGMREKLLFEAMQRYDPECHVKEKVAKTIGEDCVPAPVEEIEIETMSIEPYSIQQSVAKVKTNQEFEFIEPDYKNGSIFNTYCWSQTLKDIELHIKLPPELNSARQLIIEIKPQSITVKSRTNSDFVVFSGNLSNKFKHNDVIWTIAEGKLQITFDKLKEIWWDKLLIEEECIDPKKVHYEQYIDELPEESQAAIQKLRVQQMKQYEQQQPTNIQDSEMLIKLRKAWDMEGSPFRGHPFDPSMVKFS